MCIGYRSPLPTNMRRLIGRRGFLKAAAATAAAAGAAGTFAVPPAAAAPPHERDRQARGRKKRVPAESISIQLYSMRELMDADLDAVFRGLAEIGYRKVEHAGFHGRQARDFKLALDRHGLHATSGHQRVHPYLESEWGKMIDDALILGQRYMVEPLPLFAAAGLAGVAMTSTAWGQYAQDLNKAAEQAGRYGLAVGFHNHDLEFLPLLDDPSRTAYDILLAETDPDLVHFELDIYWAWKAEQDPVELLQANPSRYRQFHVKDMDESGGITAPGTGVIDFARIFEAAQDLGITEYTIEQDNAGSGAMESARLGYELLSTIRW